MSIYSFQVKDIDGNNKPLSDYEGKILLIVNTASKCGFTGQYEGLQELYEKYRDQGFEVLGFPSNDFLGQEPGTEEEIKNFCSLNYSVTFPMFSKIKVQGNEMHPLYKYLTENEKFGGKISWNFNKFLINRNGEVAARFGSRDEPLDETVVEAIQKSLSE